MKKLLLSLFIATSVLLSGSAAGAEILHQNQIPLQLHILEPECTIDSVDAGTGVITAYTCPKPPEPPKPVTPDPSVPVKPKPPTGTNAGWLVGVPNTGFLRTIVNNPGQSFTWLIFLGTTVFVFMVLGKRHKKPVAKTKKTSSRTKSSRRK